LQEITPEALCNFNVDDLIKSPTPSLRGATRRGNLSAIQGVMSPPWRDIAGRITTTGALQDFALESQLSLAGLGQGLPRFARNDISAVSGLFTNTSNLTASQKVSSVVTPAKAGVQNPLRTLDSRLRGNDRKRCFWTFYDFIKLDGLVKSRQLGRHSKKLQMQGARILRNEAYTEVRRSDLPC